jgi:hypothetical protein
MYDDKSAREVPLMKVIREHRSLGSWQVKSLKKIVNRKFFDRNVKSKIDRKVLDNYNGMVIDTMKRFVEEGKINFTPQEADAINTGYSWGTKQIIEARLGEFHKAFKATGNKDVVDAWTTYRVYENIVL